ncbi:hypothetical protein BCD64_26855 [Nostoc sp. MBR 210]|nr:hypothetical protein BCD64_26855 [Nostoc sp. MBR 210]
MTQNSIFVSEYQQLVPDTVLILDTETTDLDVNVGQVIELGAILYSVKHQAIIQQYSTILPAQDNPAEYINRIKPELLKQITAEQVEESLWMLNKMANKAQIIVAHNAEFDQKWFGSSSNGNTVLPELLGSNNQPLRWLCTCTDFNWPRQIRPGQSLIDLAASHEIGIWGVHRALTDCQLIASLFDKMENLNAMFEIALMPKFLFQALVTYDRRDLAKKAGFKWVAERKSWERKMTEEDTQNLPFEVRLIAAAK